MSIGESMADSCRIPHLPCEPVVSVVAMPGSGQWTSVEFK